MRSSNHRAWTAGFMAGGIFAANCPYTRGSFEALDWYGGWIAGATHALDRVDSPHIPRHEDAVPSRQSPCVRANRH